MNQKTFLPESSQIRSVESLVLDERAPQRVRSAAFKLMCELGRAANVDLKALVRPDWQEACGAAPAKK